MSEHFNPDEFIVPESFRHYRDIFDELITKTKLYHPSDDFSLIEKAYEIALEAHGSQFRKSGEPYIIHPLSVSVILAELEMDRETIIAGILHDIIEDTNYSYDDIKNMFSEEIANLVDGVTKLEKLEYSTFEDEQAENYRKMFLAMSNDIRVIIIKIADRLHNMRTLKFKEAEKQKKTAQETLDIYCPLAHRLGISKIRYELEDISFRYLNNEAYYDLKDKIQRKQSDREALVKTITDDLRLRLSNEKIEATVEGRPKHFFSIYKKMQSQNKTLDEIYDLFAVRVIVHDVRDCYEVLGVVHEMYKPIPGRFKDYIAMAKPNMYQSLHNTLIGPEGEPFEIQIRTWEMHRTAEYGIAAHWKYKEGKGGDTERSDKSEQKLAWLRDMLDWQRELSDNREFLSALKVDLNVFKDHVYCFTPKGQVVSLLNGSTPIDFAYAIHSAVGNKMVGAKVNGKIAPLEHILETGDRIEVLTSQNSKGPSADWLKIVKTSQARSKINQWFKKENKEENIAIGIELLEKGAKKKGLTLSQLLTPERLKIVLNKFSMHDWDAVCAAVGHGGLREGQVVQRLHDEYLREEGKSIDDEEIVRQLLSPEASDSGRPRYKSKSGIIIKGAGDVAPRFSKCCSPVPGDEIFAYVTRGRGVSIHRTDCPNILNLDELEKHRLVEAEWQMPEDSSAGSFRADIKLTCDDRMGLLVDISRLLTNENMSVKSLNARSVKNAAIFNVGLSISSKDELERISKKLLNLPGVNEVERVSST